MQGFSIYQGKDIEKVNCVYTLRKDARIWWDVVKKMCDVMAMIWAEFFVEFNSKCYSQVLINNKVAEFIML